MTEKSEVLLELKYSGCGFEMKGLGCSEDYPSFLTFNQLNFEVLIKAFGTVSFYNSIHPLLR